jgi:predicted transcriptional regulator YdeE
MTNGFKTIGISTRTTNKDNQSQQDFTNLWGQFYAQNIFDKIPNKVSDNVLSIYTDYKSGFTDEYTTMIDIPVSTLDEIPTELIG